MNLPINSIFRYHISSFILFSSRLIYHIRLYYLFNLIHYTFLCFCTSTMFVCRLTLDIFHKNIKTWYSTGNPDSRSFTWRFRHRPLPAAIAGTEPVDELELRRFQLQQPVLREPEQYHNIADHHEQHVRSESIEFGSSRHRQPNDDDPQQVSDP